MLNLIRRKIELYFLKEQLALHLSTAASKRVDTYPKNENPIKSPKEPPRELNKSRLLNINTSWFVLLILSVKAKEKLTAVMFSG